MITRGMLQALRTEAGEAGDLAQVSLCDRALAGDAAALQACERVVQEAEARDDQERAARRRADFGYDDDEPYFDGGRRSDAAGRL